VGSARTSSFNVFAGLWVVNDVFGLETLGYAEAVGGEIDGDDALGIAETGIGGTGTGATETAGTAGTAGTVGTDESGGAVLTILERMGMCGTATSFEVAGPVDFDIFTLVFSVKELSRSLAARFGFALAGGLDATPAQDAMTSTLLVPLSLSSGCCRLLMGRDTAR
jgi:hypothetical protein